MKINLTNYFAEWNTGEKLIRIEEQNLHQVIYSSQSNSVIALCHSENQHNSIIIYTIDGTKLFTINEPDNCHFNYIGSNRNFDIAVMVKEHKSGWLDWWYGIECKSGKLISLGEGR